MDFLDRKNKSLPLSIRDVEQGDINFIFNSWLQSFRSGLMPKKVDSTIYFSEHHKLIERILKRAPCLVAVNPDDPTQIYGYVAYEKIDGIFVLHYVYVKHPFRAMGVMRQLFKAIDHDFKTAGLFTHNTLVFERLALKYDLVYHPYILINYNDIVATSTPSPDVLAEIEATPEED
jgi:hypothetical protein